MSLFSLRPTFETQLPHSKQAVFRRVIEELTNPGRGFVCLAFDEYAELHVLPSEVRYWSPHLTLSFEGDETQTRVVGRYEPRQEVWTFVWIIYLVLSFSAFFSSIYLFSHWVLGKTTWVGILPPLAVAGIGLIYLASYVGQQLSNDQMIALRAEWMKVVEKLFPSENL